MKRAAPSVKPTADEYDAMAKLASNENPYGPPESVMKAMTDAFKYANRYGYPDGGIVEAIAAHHGVKPENVLLGAGSGEILDVCDSTFLQGGKKVVGVEPTYSTVYAYATGTKSEAIKIPLSGLNGEKMQNLRSALNRVTREKNMQVETSSDEKYLYVWRADPPKDTGAAE